MAKRLNEAYATLGDPQRRAVYDAVLAREKKSSRARQSGGARPASRSQPPPSPPAPSSRPGSASPPEAAGKPTSAYVKLWALLLGATVIGSILFASRAPPQISSNNVAADEYPPPFLPGPEEAQASAFQEATDSAALNSAGELISFDARNEQMTEVLPVTSPPEASRPNLASVAPEDRSTIELACAVQRSQGITTYNQCLQRQLGDLSGGNQFPGFTGIGREDRMTVELACAVQRSRGALTYNMCLRRQLADIRQGADHPDMSRVSRDDRMTMELTCATERSRGPSAYNACLSDQLADLNGR